MKIKQEKNKLDNFKIKLQNFDEDNKKDLKIKIEDELYLLQNQKTLSKKSYEEFLDREEVVEDM